MKPTLLLLAGMLNDERVWQPVAQRLNAVCAVRIAHFPTQETIADMAQAAWQLVADLPPDQPLALAGFCRLAAADVTGTAWCDLPDAAASAAELRAVTPLAWTEWQAAWQRLA